MARIVDSSHVSQTSGVDTRTETNEMIGGATGQITRTISRRRSHRKQWRIFECIFMIILDALMLHAAFYLAYAIRFNLLGSSPWLTQLHLILKVAGLSQPGRFEYYIHIA